MSFFKFAVFLVFVRATSQNSTTTSDTILNTSELPTTTTTSRPPENISTLNTISSTTPKLTTTTSKLITTLAVKPDAIPTTTTAEIDHLERCTPLKGNMDALTQEEFTNKLTESCRYDRLIKPRTKGILDVYYKIDLRHIENLDQLQFKSHILVQLRYYDNRLRFSDISPNRTQLLGEEQLREKIWVPHIIVRNEKESSLMGMDAKDVFISINPSGNVSYSYRMTATFYCWMNLQKFPFDSQTCEIIWVSWTYDISQLKLNWEEDNPFTIASNLHLTEFVLDDAWAITAVTPGPFAKGGRTGNYSAVIFRFKLRREVGYYIMDYFLPSMLLVCMSWVTFWLQADASAPRVTLGTSTMLAFITLNGGLTKNLPKVSYIKASEIWFLGCACFIFLSMAEFAFVNVIWRRRKKIELKKQNSKHILKGAITPSLARKQLRKAESVSSLYKTRSCSSLNSDDNGKTEQNNYLTVHSYPTLNIPTITTQSQDELIDTEDSVTTIPIPENGTGFGVDGTQPTWTTMTPQEVANWIDKKSRIVFPMSFLIFNLFYWSFVYAL